MGGTSFAKIESNQIKSNTGSLVGKMANSQPIRAQIANNISHSNAIVAAAEETKTKQLSDTAENNVLSVQTRMKIER